MKNSGNRRKTLYPIARHLLKALVYPFLEEVSGIENVPRDRGFILAANHMSYIDSVILITLLTNLLNRQVRFLAKIEHFSNPVSAKIHHYAKAIPINRSRICLNALKKTLKAINENHIIGIYPEGTRSLDGRLSLSPKPGIAQLVLSTKAEILPVGIVGTDKILPKGKIIPRFRRAKINIGHLLNFKIDQTRRTKLELNNITHQIMSSIAKLSHQEYHWKTAE